MSSSLSRPSARISFIPEPLFSKPDLHIISRASLNWIQAEEVSKRLGGAAKSGGDPETSAPPAFFEMQGPWEQVDPHPPPPTPHPPPPSSYPPTPGRATVHDPRTKPPGFVARKTSCETVKPGSNRKINHLRARISQPHTPCVSVRL